MKKHILICLAIIPFLSFSQTWNAIGNPNGIAAATQVDMQVTAGGKLYAAYIDVTNSSKVSVVRWDAPSNDWKLIGNSGIGDANVSDLQLIVLDEIYPVFAAKTMYQGNQALEIYQFTGSNWVSRSTGIGTYNQVDHSANYALSGTSQNNWFVTFKDAVLLSPTSGRMISINMATQALYGTASSYALLSSASGKMDAYIDENRAGIIHGQTGVTSTIHLDASNGGGVYAQNHTFETNLLSNNITKMQIERNDHLSAYSFIWSSGASNYPLKFNTLVNTTLNSEIVLSSEAPVTDFEFDTQNDDAFVFYKTAASCFYVKIGNVTAPLVSVISSGNSLAPASATSLETEVYNDIYVIAYVDQGKFFVKEYDLPAAIVSQNFFSLCEESALTDPANNSIPCSDPNFSHQGLSMTCISQNQAVISNSMITVTGEGTLRFSANINSTHNVQSPTIVDLQVELFDNGISRGTKLIPVTVYPKPDIVFTNPVNEACKNTDPINLNGLAYPSGGTWSGTGIQNNTFDPSYPSGSTVEMTYTKTNQYGCTQSNNLNFTLHQPPVPDVSSSSSDCNQHTGTASVEISGGLPPYAIYWNTGSDEAIVHDLMPGSYFVSVTDANGCVSTGTSIVETNGLSQSGTVQGASCYGAANGSIAITTSGGVAPLSYSWSNGARDKDLSGLAHGPYELTITDAEGCISAASYFVPEPQKIMLSQLSITQPACSESNGQVTASFQGGTAPFTYSWTDAQGTDLNHTNASLPDIGAGTYFCTVTDANNCTFTSSALVSNTFGPNVIISSTSASSCANDGAIQLHVISGDPQSYLWTNGATTPDISELAPGTYSVAITGASGCVTVLGASIHAALPPKAPICLVTVNESINENQVSWEKPFVNGISHFNIYRESSQAGLYQLIGTKAYSDAPVFSDTVASPDARSWRYKVSTVNDCGIESEWSSAHKTIHLTVNRGLQNDINLSWNQYEGFPYSNFILKRYTHTHGWEQIAVMPNNLFTYTDQPPSTIGLTYVVLITAPNSCSGMTATRSNTDKRFATDQPNGLSERNGQFVSLYPNPANAVLHVENGSGQPLEAQILDQTGRFISPLVLIPGHTPVDCGKLASGMYHLEIHSQEVNTLKRFVIER